MLASPTRARTAQPQRPGIFSLPRGRELAAAGFALVLLCAGSAATARRTQPQRQHLVVNGAGPVGLLFASTLMDRLKAEGIDHQYRIVVVEKRPKRGGPDVRDERLLNLSEPDVELALRVGVPPDAFERIRFVESHHFSQLTRRNVHLPTLQPVDDGSGTYLTRAAMPFDEAIEAALRHGEDAPAQFLRFTAGTLTHRISLARYVRELERAIARRHNGGIAILRDAELGEAQAEASRVDAERRGDLGDRLASYPIRQGRTTRTLRNVRAVFDATGGGAASQRDADLRYGTDETLGARARELGMERGVTLVVLTLKTPPDEVERLVTYNDNHIRDPGAILISRSGATSDAPHGKSSALFLLEPDLPYDEAIDRAQRRLREVLAEPVELLPNGRHHVIPLRFSALETSIAPSEPVLRVALGAVLAAAAPQRSQGLTNQGRDAAATATDLADLLAGKITESTFTERREQRFDLMKRAFFGVFRSWRPGVKRRPLSPGDVWPGDGSLHWEAASLDDVTLDSAVDEMRARLEVMRQTLERGELPTTTQLNEDVLRMLEAQRDGAPFLRVERAVPLGLQARDGAGGVATHAAWRARQLKALATRLLGGAKEQPQPRPDPLDWAGTRSFFAKLSAKFLRRSAWFGAQISGRHGRAVAPAAVVVDKLIDSLTAGLAGDVVVGGAAVAAALFGKYADLAWHRGPRAAWQAARAELAVERAHRMAFVGQPDAQAASATEQGPARVVLTKRARLIARYAGGTPIRAPGVVESARDFYHHVPDALGLQLHFRRGWQPAAARLYERGRLLDPSTPARPAIPVDALEPSVDDARHSAFTAVHEAVSALSHLTRDAIAVIEQHDKALLGVRHAASAVKPFPFGFWLHARRWAAQTWDLSRVIEAVYRVDRVLARIGRQLQRAAADADRGGFSEAALAKEVLSALQRIEPVLSALTPTLKRYVLAARRAHLQPAVEAEQLRAAESAISQFCRRVTDEIVHPLARGLQPAEPAPSPEAGPRPAGGVRRVVPSRGEASEAPAAVLLPNRRAEEFVEAHRSGATLFGQPVLSEAQAAEALAITLGALRGRIKRANEAGQPFGVKLADGVRVLHAADVAALGGLRDELPAAQAARELGLSTRQLHKLASTAGIAPRELHNGRKVYTVADISRLLALPPSSSTTASGRGGPHRAPAKQAPQAVDDRINVAAEEAPLLDGKPVFSEDQTAKLLCVPAGALSLRAERLRQSGAEVGRRLADGTRVFDVDEARQLSAFAVDLVQPATGAPRPTGRGSAARTPRWRSVLSGARLLAPRGPRPAVATERPPTHLSTTAAAR